MAEKNITTPAPAKEVSTSKNFFKRPTATTVLSDSATSNPYSWIPEELKDGEYEYRWVNETKVAHSISALGYHILELNKDGIDRFKHDLGDRLTDDGKIVRVASIRGSELKQYLMFTPKDIYDKRKKTQRDVNKLESKRPDDKFFQPSETVTPE